MTFRINFFAELATGCENARTPWAVIGEDPAKFFDPSCIPSGFKFQDPSRMGITVKLLLSHLRARQETLGVDAFQFHHVLRNNKIETAEYPSDSGAQGQEAAPTSALDELPTVLTHEATLQTATPSRKNGGVKTAGQTPKKKVTKSENTITEAICPNTVSTKIR